jgi:hypothetical protein
MSSKSARRGASTSTVEVLNISAHGFWLLVAGEEFFLPFAQFPWFRGATVEELLAVTLPGAGHLYWPDLDVDLAIASIRNPSAFPLVARARA